MASGMPIRDVPETGCLEPEITEGRILEAESARFNPALPDGSFSMMRPKSSGIVAVIAAGVFAWAPLARAASAVIVAPGAQARAQPTETAAVLQTYATGDKVFVSPEITARFRRIALPDKRTGFIRDDDVRVDGAPRRSSRSRSRIRCSSSRTSISWPT